jgi:hypothetical protein
MLPLLAALAAAVQPALPPATPGLDRTAWLFSTVGQSEWCPPGNVTVDLGTGRYSLTPRAPRRICHRDGLERPRRRGTLAGRRLAQVRAAYLRALSEGLKSQVCREGGRPRDVIVINNGGTPILVVTSGSGSQSAPDGLYCWSDAANALHITLDEVFSTSRWR